MQAILGALTHGYSTLSVINQLKRQFPQYSRQIEAAQIAGYTGKSIINQLAKDATPKERGQLAALTEHERTQQQDTENKRSAGKKALLAAGALAGGAYGLHRLAQAGQAIQPSAILPALPGSAPQIGGPAAQLGLPNLSARGMPKPPGPSPMGPQPTPNAPMSPIAQQAAAQNLPQSILRNDSLPRHGVELLKNLGEDVRIKNLLEGGLDVASIAANLKQFGVSKEKIQALKQAPGGVEGVISDFANFLQENPQELQKQTEPGQVSNPIAQMQPEQPNAVLEPQEETALTVKEQPKPFQPKKNDLVMTPYGPAEIKGVDARGIIAEVDGKTERFDPEDIEEPEPAVKRAIEDLLKIPEEDRSSNIALFSYDPSDNEAFFQFHDGSFYRYKSVPPELVKEIAEKNAIPITSGENMYGVWSPDDKKSIGAALWKYMLKDPRWAKAKKGEEKNQNYRKLDVHYDYWKDLRAKKKGKKKK